MNFVRRCGQVIFIRPGDWPLTPSYACAASSIGCKAAILRYNHNGLGGVGGPADRRWIPRQLPSHI
ncbi:hypothetical protein BJY00DRAFT_289344 [Aspergillus carlsbadensis]|nr:hypothetical protein BJY00DRAFT_289344 [Aspergillus carlsbadensis]